MSDSKEFPGYYTVNIFYNIGKSEIILVRTLNEVYETIQKCPDYLHHRQNIRIDPYGYIIVTTRFYLQARDRLLG